VIITMVIDFLNCYFCLQIANPPPPLPKKKNPQWGWGTMSLL